MSHHSNELKDLIEKFKSDQEKGLTDQQVNIALDLYGPNAIEDNSGRSFWKILFTQVNNLLTYILLVAIFVSLLSGHQFDAGIITLLVLINISIGTTLEYRAEKRVSSLKDLIQHRCKVIRNDTEIVVNTDELVPGDIVLLEDGQSVPADIRLITSNDLSTIEGSLTGESAPINKEVVNLPDDTPIGDRTNMLFMGTYISTGECKGMVVATGMSTQLGLISDQLENVMEEKSLFYSRTEKLMRQMIIVSFLTTLFSVTILWIRGSDIMEIYQI